MKADKERRICEALWTLLAAGRPAHEITVSEIAKEAGIGKGTLYDYFNSKEEIFGASIAAVVQDVLAKILAGVRSAPTFADQVDVLLQAASAVSEQTSGLLIQIFYGAGPVLLAGACANGEIFAPDEIMAIGNCLTARAKAEGYLAQDADPARCGFVLAGCVGAYFAGGRLQHLFGSMSPAARRDIVLGMLTGGLAQCSPEMDGSTR